jgi:YidC/Oxa1 family membrane protein insertase
MQLFKEQGINPLGGCLPMLIQLPIMLALYRAINLSLAKSPFELIDLADRLLLSGFDAAIPLKNIWMGIDLTQPPTANPTIALALPLLVMITTWAQSKLTMPSTPPSDDNEPNQTAQMTKSMTTMMPLMFGFFSLSFSVGLSIYFFVSNLVGILQYTMTGKAEWGNLIDLGGLFGGAKAEPIPAKSTNGKSAVATLKGATNQSDVEMTPTDVMPKRPSKRKDKKMKRASEQPK